MYGLFLALTLGEVEAIAGRLAGGLGFEPRLTESESAVLPLNYPPKPITINAL
jgi:hypothetical protein